MKPSLTQARSIGEFCAMARAREELTQQEIARKLRTSRAIVAQIEADLNGKPITYCKKLQIYLTKDEVSYMKALLIQDFLKEFEN